MSILEQQPSGIRLNDGYHIIKLSRNQVLKGWKAFYRYISDVVLPASSPSELHESNLLASLHSGNLVFWAGYVVNNGVPKLSALMTTLECYDQGSGERTLLIYSLQAKEKVLPTWWQQGLKILRKYAKSRGIQKICAYTRLAKLAEFSKKFGASINYTIVLEVNDNGRDSTRI